MRDETYKYWAFISYSHRDQAWAEWLHHALETYSVPRRLVGRESAAGPVPRRLFPVFRDQEELPSTPDLSGAIDQALSQSRYLIVIASPYAAVSKWVDQEIARFRALGRGDRILCLIVDGEPHAGLLPDRGQLECFPPSLRGEGGLEPIAADVRSGKDGKPAARLKLIAGLLGVGLDELRRRERRRRLLQNLGLAGVCTLSAVVLAGLWHMQQGEKKEALAQQALRTHIEAVYENGRQELLAHNQARAAVYLDEAYKLGVDTPALRFMLARAMRIVESEKRAFQTGNPVTAVRLSPDGKRLFSRGADNIVRVWDAGTGHKYFEFGLPAGAKIAGPRFSRDNRLLYMFAVPRDSATGYLGIWDADSGRQVANITTAPSIARTFNPFGDQDRLVAYLAPDGAAEIIQLDSGRVLRHLNGAYTVAGFSRDGRNLLTGLANGEVQKWDQAGLHKLQSFSGLQSPIIEIDDTENGALVAASARDGSVRAWQAADGALRVIGGHPSPRPWMIFNLDGNRLFTGATDGVRVWDTANGSLVYAMQFAGSSGFRFDITSSGRWILASSTSRLAMQDLQSGLELFTLDGNRGLAGARDVSEDDREIATGGPDGRVVLWDTPRIPDAEFRHPVDFEHLEKLGLLGVASVYDHAGGRIFTGAADGKLRAWDARSGGAIFVADTDSQGVNTLDVSDDDQQVLSGGEADGIKLWEARSGRLLRGFDCNHKQVLSAAFSRGGRYVLGVVYGGDARVWEAATGEVIGSFPHAEAGVARFTPDGARLALGGEGRIGLWDLTQRRYLWTQSLPARQGSASPMIAAMDFSGDGSRLLAASTGSDAFVFDVNGGGRISARLSEPSASNLLSARFDPAGRLAVFGDASGVALMWRLADGKTWILRGHAGEVRTAEFSRDSSFVLTSSIDATARVWDAATGQLLDVIAEHGSPMPRTPFSAASLGPDGDSVLTGSTDGVIRLWKMRKESRSPQQIESVLRCRVPWRLDGESLAPATPDDAACAGD